MKYLSLLLFSVFWLAACSGRAASPLPSATPVPSASAEQRAASPAPTQAPAQSPTRPIASAEPTPAGVDPAPTASPAAPAPDLRICPPLSGMAWEELPDRITNPFLPPRPGSDDPHQGIDIADFIPGSRIAVRGRGVQAVLDGTVATVLDGRFPFGFGLIVETPLTGLLAESLLLPPPYEEVPLPTTLTCPGVKAWEADTGSESLYLLYAHLDALPNDQVGAQVACGSWIGEIGDSGNALNPHVHLELRVGPAGASFPGMTHYNPAATEAEMDAYCAWRVGGLFRLMDPGALLLLGDGP